jgi:predicted  nucleic acid-binding Zn-ribbon protein
MSTKKRGLDNGGSENAIERLQRQLEQIDERLREAINRSDYWERRYNNFAAENTNRVAHLEERSQSLAAENTKLEAEFNRLSDEMQTRDAAITKLQTTEAAASQQNEKYKATVERLQTDKTSLEQQVVDVRTRSERAEQENEKLQQQIDALTQTNATLQQRVVHLQTEKAKSDAAVKEQRDINTGLVEDLLTEKQHVEHWEREVVAVKAELEEARERIQKLQNQMTIDLIDVSGGDDDEEKKKLKKDLEDATKRITTLSQQVTTANNTIKRLDADIITQQQKHTQEIAEHQRAARVLADKIRQLQAQLAARTKIDVIHVGNGSGDTGSGDDTGDDDGDEDVGDGDVDDADGGGDSAFGDDVDVRDGSGDGDDDDDAEPNEDANTDDDDDDEKAMDLRDRLHKAKQENKDLKAANTNQKKRIERVEQMNVRLTSKIATTEKTLEATKRKNKTLSEEVDTLKEEIDALRDGGAGHGGYSGGGVDYVVGGGGDGEDIQRLKQQIEKLKSEKAKLKTDFEKQMDEVDDTWFEFFDDVDALVTYMLNGGDPRHPLPSADKYAEDADTDDFWGALHELVQMVDDLKRGAVVHDPPPPHQFVYGGHAVHYYPPPQPDDSNVLHQKWTDFINGQAHLIKEWVDNKQLKIWPDGVHVYFHPVVNAIMQLAAVEEDDDGADTETPSTTGALANTASKLKGVVSSSGNKLKSGIRGIGNIVKGSLTGSSTVDAALEFVVNRLAPGVQVSINNLPNPVSAAQAVVNLLRGATKGDVITVTPASAHPAKLDLTRVVHPTVGKLAHRTRDNEDDEFVRREYELMKNGPRFSTTLNALTCLLD